MTTATVADALAWQDLSEETREQYKRVLYDEIRDEVERESGGYESGYFDGKTDLRGELRHLVHDAEEALASDPPKIDEANKILDELSREVG